jgi:hypothetical protein
MSISAKLGSIFFLCLILQGCLGTIVGAATDVVIEVAKVPFKVGGAVVDVVDGDDSKKTKKSTRSDEGDGQ